MLIIVISSYHWQVSLDDYGIDWDGPLPTQEWDGSHEENSNNVEVLSTQFPFCQQEVEQMQRIIDPLRDSQYCGVDIYMEVVYLLEQRLSDGDMQ